MGFKHKTKFFLRSVYARVLFHSGAHALVDRLMPRRLTILAGHCVSAESNARLSGDMKIEGEKLARILGWFARRYEMTNVAVGVRRIRERGKMSLVALSMDDGYRDNRSHLLPLLRTAGVSATIYLESRPLDLRRVNWSHKLFAMIDALGPQRFIERYVELSRDEHANALLLDLSARGAMKTYAIKRVLKYEARAAERNRVTDVMFAQTGGDERALCDELYMTWDDARALRDAGVELGGHTVHHEILSRLDPLDARREVEEGRSALRRELGIESESFAYPFGRKWDFADETRALVAAAGFKSAVTTHAGTNGKESDPYALKRLMIDENAKLYLLAAEACGGFDLLRKLGIDLSE